MKPRFDESSDSSRDNDSEEEEPQKVITKHPTKKIDIENISKEFSPRDMWLYVDYKEIDVANSSTKKPSETNKTCKQKEDIVYLNTISETMTDIPKSFKDFNLTDSNEYISLRVLREEEDCHVINEFIVSVKQFRKYFKTMKMIMRSNADEYQEVLFSAKACIILIRFLFYDTFYINNLPAALATYVLAMYTHLKKLEDQCFEVGAAEKMKMRLTNKRLKTFVKDFFQDDLGNLKCFIGYSQSLNFSDIYFPLYRIQLTLNETFEKDIINTAIVESLKGWYFIMGVDLCFDTKSENCNFPLTIIYKVRVEDIFFENEIQDYLRPVINISFKQDMLTSVSNLKGINRQKIEITIIVEDLKPGLCFSSLDTQYVQKTHDGEFYVSLLSSRKTDSNDSLFYLKKLYLLNILRNKS